MTMVPQDLASLSTEELKALRRHWWEVACQDGSIAAIVRVVRELGERRAKKHGANWIWSAGSVEIVLDDWTGHTYASVGDRQVFAVNYTSKLFVPGAWMDTVWAADVEANLKIAARRRAASNDEHRALLRQLGAS